MATRTGDDRPTASHRPTDHLATPRHTNARRWIAGALVVMAVLAVIVSTLALWTHRFIFDTDTYVETVAPVTEDPDVRHALAVYVSDRALELTDLEARLGETLPAAADGLAAPLTAEVRRILVTEIQKYLATEQAQGLWTNANRIAHEQLITALRDENPYVTVGEDDVTLNLLPLLAVTLQKLADRLPRLADLAPRIDPETAPAQIRGLLEKAFDKELPDDFGTITVLRGGQGYQAKRALRIFNDLVIAVVLVTVALVVMAVLVSPRRRRTALHLGLGLLVAFAVTRVIEAQAEKAIVAAIASEGGIAVARAVVSSVIGGLNGFLVWAAVAGALVTAVAVFADRPQWMDAAGRGVARLFGVSASLAAPGTRASAWVAAHLDLLRLAGVAVAVVVVPFVADSLSVVFVVVLALVAYELALAAYAVSLPREEPGGPPSAP